MHASLVRCQEASQHQCARVQEREGDVRAREAALSASEDALASKQQTAERHVATAQARADDAERELKRAKAEARTQAAAELAEHREAASSEQRQAAADMHAAQAMHEQGQAALDRCVRLEHQMGQLQKEHAAALSAQQSQQQALQQQQRLAIEVCGVVQNLHERIASAQSKPSGASASCVAALQDTSAILQRASQQLQSIQHSAGTLKVSHRQLLDQVQSLQQALQHERQTATAAEESRLAASAAQQAAEAALRDVRELVHEADAGQERALSQAEDCRLALKHAHAELAAAQSGRTRRRDYDDGQPQRIGAVRCRTASPSMRHSAGKLATDQGESQSRPAAAQAVHSGTPGPRCAVLLPAQPVVTARLAALEQQEAALQADFAAYRTRMNQTQARLAHCSARAASPAHLRCYAPVSGYHSAAHRDDGTAAHSGACYDPDYATGTASPAGSAAHVREQSRAEAQNVSACPALYGSKLDADAPEVAADDSVIVSSPQQLTTAAAAFAAHGLQHAELQSAHALSSCDTPAEAASADLWPRDAATEGCVVLSNSLGAPTAVPTAGKTLTFKDGGGSAAARNPSVSSSTSADEAAAGAHNAAALQPVSSCTGNAELQAAAEWLPDKANSAAESGPTSREPPASAMCSAEAAPEQADPDSEDAEDWQSSAPAGSSRQELNAPHADGQMSSHVRPAAAQLSACSDSSSSDSSSDGAKSTRNADAFAAPHAMHQSHQQGDELELLAVQHMHSSAAAAQPDDTSWLDTAVADLSSAHSEARPQAVHLVKAMHACSSNRL